MTFQLRIISPRWEPWWSFSTLSRHLPRQSLWFCPFQACRLRSILAGATWRIVQTHCWTLATSCAWTSSSGFWLRCQCARRVYRRSLPTSASLTYRRRRESTVPLWPMFPSWLLGPGGCATFPCTIYRCALQVIKQSPSTFGRLAQ